MTVSGSFGGVPQLEFAKPLTVTEPYIEVVWEGDGPEAVEGSTVLLNLFGQDGRDGTQIVDTYDELPRVHEVTIDSLGGRLHSALLGQEAGARVLVVEEVDGARTLMPFVTAIVPTVDVPGGRVVLTPPGGLLARDAANLDVALPEPGDAEAEERG
mgnify:CR=1 FL=1